MVKMRSARSAGFLLFSLAVLAAPSWSQDRSQVTVIDGRTLDLSGQIAQLRGIEVPALGEQCLFFGRMQDCGVIARSQLMDLTAGARIECEFVDRPDAAAPSSVRCRSNGYDLSEGMVHTGWATAAIERYRSVQRDAQAARRGQWRDGAPQ